MSATEAFPLTPQPTKLFPGSAVSLIDIGVAVSTNMCDPDGGLAVPFPDTAIVSVAVSCLKFAVMFMSAVTFETVSVLFVLVSYGRWITIKARYRGALDLVEQAPSQGGASSS